MKEIRGIVFAALLTISSAASAVAGDMQTPGRTDPPLPPPPATVSTTVVKNAPSPSGKSQVVLPDLLTALLREVWLALF